MPEFYRFYADKESMLLWNPYFSFRIVEPKTTKYGSFEKKIMISCGRSIMREIDKERIEMLPKDVREKLVSKYSLETYTLPDISVKEKIINKVIVAYKKFGKLLGISLEKYEGGKGCELFQFAKFAKTSELEPIINGISMSFGILSHMERMNRTRREELIRRLQQHLRKSFDVGYEKARENKW